jgi:hypothetical protein
VLASILACADGHEPIRASGIQIGETGTATTGDLPYLPYSAEDWLARLPDTLAGTFDDGRPFVLSLAYGTVGVGEDGYRADAVVELVAPMVELVDFPEIVGTGPESAAWRSLLAPESGVPEALADYPEVYLAFGGAVGADGGQGTLRWVAEDVGLPLAAWTAYPLEMP